MDWTAIGAIGSAIGSLSTAITVLIYLKPYRKKIVFAFGMQGDGYGNEYSLTCFNDGRNIYCNHIRLRYKKDKNAIVECINQKIPFVFKRESEYNYVFDDTEMDTIRYFIIKHDIKEVNVELYDVSGKKYKGKLDVSFFNLIAKAQQRIRDQN